MYPKNRKDSPTKTCPVCQKEVAARGLNAHIRLTHTTMPRAAKSIKTNYQKPLDFSYIGEVKSNEKPMYRKSLQKPIMDFQAILVTLGVAVVMKLITNYMEQEAIRKANDKHS